MNKDDYIKLYDDPSMYDNWNIGKEHHRSKFLLENVLGPDVLELGCGGSGFLRLLYDKKDDTGLSDTGQWRLTGVDINPKWIKAGKERLPKVTYVHSLLEEYDAGHVFDTVIMMEVLEHVLDPELCIVSAIRNTIGGGKILLTVPKAGSEYDFTDNHLRQYTMEKMEELLYGLDYKLWEDEDYTIYGVITR